MLKNSTKRQQKDIKIRVRLMSLSKIMDGIQNIILGQFGNVRKQYLKMYGLKSSLHLTLTL